jgi:tripartite-type tricarboxylate transporter receptor subunit TctC
MTKPLVSLTSIVAGLALAAAGASAQTADYPNKPIKIVVPYAAGGSTDAIARMVAERLTQRLGQPAIVENRPGAAEQIAIVGVAKSAPDGYTLLLSTLTGLAVNPGLYGPKLSYNPQKDLVPVLLAATVPSAVVVHPSVPAKTMAELATYLKNNPGKVSYASAGNGTPSHLGMEYYKRQNGVDPVHVPYKGGAPALQEVAGGQVQVMMALVPEAMPLVKAGRLRALAVTSAQRLAPHPEVPTVVESGGKAFDMTFWYAFMAPAGTPNDVVTKLNRTMDAILQDKDLRAKFAEMSLDVAGGAPTKVSDVMRADSAKWKKVIDDAGIKVD